jgi:hypothetical protein
MEILSAPELRGRGYGGFQASCEWISDPESPAGHRLELAGREAGRHRCPPPSGTAFALDGSCSSPPEALPQTVPSPEVLRGHLQRAVVASARAERSDAAADGHRHKHALTRGLRGGGVAFDQRFDQGLTEDRGSGGLPSPSRCMGVRAEAARQLPSASSPPPTCSTPSMGRSARGQSRKPVMFRNATSSAPSSAYLRGWGGLVGGQGCVQGRARRAQVWAPRPGHLQGSSGQWPKPGASPRAFLLRRPAPIPPQHSPRRQVHGLAQVADLPVALLLAHVVLVALGGWVTGAIERAAGEGASADAERAISAAQARSARAKPPGCRPTSCLAVSRPAAPRPFQKRSPWPPPGPRCRSTARRRARRPARPGCSRPVTAQCPARPRAARLSHHQVPVVVRPHVQARDDALRQPPPRLAAARAAASRVGHGAGLQEGAEDVHARGAGLEVGEGVRRQRMWVWQATHRTLLAA